MKIKKNKLEEKTPALGFRYRLPARPFSLVVYVGESPGRATELAEDSCQTHNKQEERNVMSDFSAESKS